MFRWKKAAVAVAIASLALAGCTPTGGDDTAPTTLTLGAILPATTFEAANMDFANESPYGQAVYDTLLKADPTNKILPSLATEWSYNDDKTVLTLKLRDDVTFTDGEKFNADAAVQNLLRFRDGTPANASYLASVSDVTAVDDSTIEITLSAVDPALLEHLTKSAGYQESPAAFDNADVQSNPVGSGPYILNVDKTVAGSSYVFDKNPDYWDTSVYQYDSLVINAYTDPTALSNALKGGQLDAANTFPGNNLDELKAAGYTLLSGDLNWSGMILFDRTGKINPALADVRVRQAINYAFDTKGLLKALSSDLGTTTTQIFPPSSVAYDEKLDSRYSYDPAKAKELLAEAGYPDGFTLALPSTTFVAPATFSLMTQQLGDVGITTEYTDPGQNYIPDLLQGKYAAASFLLEQGSDWDVIGLALSVGAPFNAAHEFDPTAEQLITTARDGSAEESEAAIKALNAYVVEQAWFAPWYRPQTTFVVNSKTTATLQNGNAYPYLWNILPAS